MACALTTRVLVTCALAACAIFGLVSCSSHEDPPADEVVALFARYSGPTEAGAVVGGESGIVVEAGMEDGSYCPVEGWSLDSPPATLERNGFSTVWVSYGDARARVDVECSDIDEEEFKARCVSETRDELVADPDLDVGMKVRVEGVVCQVNEPDGDQCASCYLSGTGEFADPDEVSSALGSDADISGRASDDLIAVIVPAGASIPSRFDSVVVWGRFRQMKTIEVVGGSPIEVPVVSASYLERS